MKWKAAKIQVIVEGKMMQDEISDWVNLTQFHLKGAHDSQTSINYSHRVDLGSFLQTGSSIRAKFTLIGGSTFQINGMAFCNSPPSI